MLEVAVFSALEAISLLGSPMVTIICCCSCCGLRPLLLSWLSFLRVVSPVVVVASVVLLVQLDIQVIQRYCHLGELVHHFLQVIILLLCSSA